MGNNLLLLLVPLLLLLLLVLKRLRKNKQIKFAKKVNAYA
jgi:hypothetical protein